MTRFIAILALIVPDYDQAIGFYVGKLGFTLTEDTELPGGKRWVVVTPAGGQSGLLLAKAASAAQTTAIGNQTGGRVGFFLQTDNFAADHAAMWANGVHFLEEPRTEGYGKVAVFTDPFGNKWDLLQSNRQGTAEVQATRNHVSMPETECSSMWQ